MRRAEARSAGIDRPAGVTRRFHVSEYKVEPRKTVFACNLFSKDDIRAALRDEMIECWPKMPLVSKPNAFACRAERLTRTGAGPHRSVVGPSGKSQGIAPHPDTGKEVALVKPGKVSWNDIFNAPLIDFPGSNVPGLDEFAQPCSSEWVMLVVICKCH
nr:hypothetical protein [Nitratidesulfovibrio oxamicus]